MKLPPRDLPLGQDVAYPTAYDPTLLYPISRSLTREPLQLSKAPLPFTGWDLWNAYEISWLNFQGMPQVAMLRLLLDCQSPNIIESKSLKLYLNSFNQAQFESSAAVLETIRSDLSSVAGDRVSVELIGPDAFAEIELSEFECVNLDTQSLTIDCYEPNAELLQLAIGNDPSPRTVSESVFSRLLKSNCPVTSQPDWACLKIDYTGCPIDHASLLKYIVSFRMHNGFHEHCVETIFMDIMSRCKPERLSVFARYTRRGGLDINPWRATQGMPAPSLNRSVRQ